MGETEVLQRTGAGDNRRGADRALAMTPCCGEALEVE